MKMKIEYIESQINYMLKFRNINCRKRSHYSSTKCYKKNKWCNEEK